MDNYYYYGDDNPAVLVLLAAFGFLFLIIGVALYIVTAVFLMKLLKNTGHKNPIAAWVPIWNSVTLYQVGGLKQPWIWVLGIFAGSFLSYTIPVIGPLLYIPVLIASVIIAIYVAKGVQAGLQIDSIGGIVLAVVFPIIWIIWMAIASGKSRYNLEAAIAEGDKMPMNWFGDTDRYEPFNSFAPASASYTQPQSQYGPPVEDPFPTPAPVPAPQASSWPEPPQNMFNNPPVEAESAESDSATFIPDTPPVPPRFGGDVPPATGEETEDEIRKI